MANEIENEIERVLVNGIQQFSLLGQGILIANNVNVTSTATRLNNDSNLINELTLLADSSNTEPILIGEKNQLTYPLSAGQTLILKNVIPANIYCSSSANGILHYIYGGQV